MTKTTPPTPALIQTQTPPSDNLKTGPRPLRWWEVDRLKRQGCSSRDWSRVRVVDPVDFDRVWHCDFLDDVTFGPLHATPESPFLPGLSRSGFQNTVIGANPAIVSVGLIRGAEIGAEVRLEKVGAIIFDPVADCGVGTQVGVLDETGSRPVRIYPGLSAQVAMLAARRPQWAESHLSQLVDEKILDNPPKPRIGDRAIVRNVKYIRNVYMSHEAVVDSAARLVNGSVINNSPAKGSAISRVGADVDAENFIFEDAVVDGGSYIRNCYVGQGAVVDKRFSAHDSLIFANCSLENGEACAIFAGPYTVSMHKSTLLIGAVSSFMNAGSATNQSNHMYKLGPVHWGVMERGVKTASGSYMMWGARIGAFSLVMGPHKNHPDSSDFPFSYLFGDATGATSIVPGKMLQSCGLLRDELKWPTRDRRLRHFLPLNDRINFQVLNPLTVGTMLKALDLIKTLLSKPADDDLFIRYKGMKTRATHLERARNIYTLAICKYLHTLTESEPLEPTPLNADGTPEEPEEWLDLAGQIITRATLQQAMQAESLQEMEEVLDQAHDEYALRERRWAAVTFAGRDEFHPVICAQRATEFDALIEEDRAKYLEALAAEQQMLDL